MFSTRSLEPLPYTNNLKDFKLTFTGCIIRTFHWHKLYSQNYGHNYYNPPQFCHSRWHQGTVCCSELTILSNCSGNWTDCHYLGNLNQSQKISDLKSDVSSMNILVSHWRRSNKTVSLIVTTFFASELVSLTLMIVTLCCVQLS
jgi:hypothetical protein